MPSASLNVIAIARYLRQDKGWEFRSALATARSVRDLADAGTLPHSGTIIVPEVGQEVYILQMEVAGGLVRLETESLALIVRD